MRIFQVIENSTNTSIPGNKTWYRNLYEPLIELGHDVVLFDANEGRVAMSKNESTLRARFSQKLLESFRKEHSKSPFSLFFAYLMDGMVDPYVIDEIKKTGVLTCNFSCNNAHQFYLVDELSPHFDFNLHAEKLVKEKFLEIGANPLWWPMASNPTYFKPLNLSRHISASFVGANYARRSLYISYLLENEIDTQVFGPGWIYESKSQFHTLARRALLMSNTFFSGDIQKQSAASAKLADFDFKRLLAARFPKNIHHPVSDEELIALYSKSHISLGFLEVFDNHDPSKTIIQHLHLREFEAPMSGALYCTGYTDELAEMFTPDKEILTYNSQYELLDKVKYYLTHPIEAEKVRNNGRKRALLEHTYHIRYQYLFKTLGLS
jgi:hypothetical protein